MPIYQYKCSKCNKIFEIIQSTKEQHDYVCPDCDDLCARMFTTPQIKKNEGFHSQMLGIDVKSQTDFREKEEKMRYLNDMNQYLGNNYTPKDEWIEEKIKKQEQKEKEQAELEPEYAKYYDKVETFRGYDI